MYASGILHIFVRPSVNHDVNYSHLVSQLPVRIVLVGDYMERQVTEFIGGVRISASVQQRNDQARIVPMIVSSDV